MQGNHQGAPALERALLADLQHLPLASVTQRKKHSTIKLSAFRCVGIYLSFRAATSQVLSAQVSLTAVFGMGTGVPSPPSTPTME